MFSYSPRKVEAVELVGTFTPEEMTRIMVLQRQYRTYPDRFRFDINYWRLEFTRWLVMHGYLDEWYGSRAEQNEMAPDGHGEKYPARCASLAPSLSCCAREGADTVCRCAQPSSGEQECLPSGEEG